MALTISVHELADRFWSHFPPSSLQVNVFIGDLDAATDGNNMTGDASIGSLM
jgi:hypothetical protein